MGDQQEEVVEDRREVGREYKADEKGRDMSGTASEGEGSVGHEADFVDSTANTDVDVRVPLEVDWRPDSPRGHVGATSGADHQCAVGLGQEEQCQFEPPNGPIRNGPT